MDTPDPDADDLFLDAVDAVVLEALRAIGSDPEARFSFFRRLLAVAREAAVERGGSGHDLSAARRSTKRQ